MTGKLVEYFNKQLRLGVISTSNKDGLVDCAVYGSPQMIDEKTVIVALARGRTFANLQENPNAVFMIMEPGAGVLDWKGIRVYLNLLEYATSGPKLETYKNQMARIVGEQAAEMIAVLATFEVTQVRPLIDFGQGWEKSI
ncbi:MAG: pyridoxamine 5'-phosphate oxidase family protein [Methanothrix sp.]|jgi:hypothetical protein|nr:pyridoxamine 5'-phosphate oxidase family protein [Methanothrix sp.]